MRIHTQHVDDHIDFDGDREVDEHPLRVGQRDVERRIVAPVVLFDLCARVERGAHVRGGRVRRESPSGALQQVTVVGGGVNERERAQHEHSTCEQVEREEHEPRAVVQVHEQRERSRAMHQVDQQLVHAAKRSSMPFELIFVIESRSTRTVVQYE